ncbi:MAG: L,D-transpeptidase [Spirochaetes bacterium]|jgi:murein L,D-transpeptidase YafK|nr:L,D-transpeptidase [Spirochaetota bacterium]
MRFLITILLFILSYPSIVYTENKVHKEYEKRIKSAFSDYTGEYVIYVSKKKFTLTVYNRRIRAEKKFSIGYGLNPDKKPKLYHGDERTPEGVYKVTEILSLRAKRRSKACRKLRAMNNVYFRARHGYYKYGREDVDLGKRSYGPRFFRLDYPNNEDIFRYNDALSKGEIPILEDGRFRSIGSGIGIHGNNDPPSIGHLSSSGCIRLHNRDVIKLDKYIELNTPVIISHE